MIQVEKSGTLACRNDQALVICMATQQGGAEVRVDDKAPTPAAAAGMSGNNQPIICIQGNTINRNAKQNGLGISQEPMFTINTVSCHAVFEPKQAEGAEIAEVDCRNGTENPDINGTLQAKSGGGISVNYQNTVRVGNAVRRLTPLECERLQGFPDGWTDIGTWTDAKGKSRETSDAARYKALGNSIAIPPWAWVLKRLGACYEGPATMASLFDGIGGFPLIWERLNGPGSCIWASEIEEFPIAVTKLRFGGDAV